MNLITDEKILMDGDYKQIILTTHRIRQEIKSWGQIDLVSIMLEDVTSCEYSKKSNPIFLILGILVCGFGVFTGTQGGGSEALNISGGILLAGIILILVFFFTIKHGLFISSASSKIKLNTKGMKYDNIKAFIDKLESAKSERNSILKIKSE